MNGEIKVLDNLLGTAMQLSRSPDVAVSLAATEEIKILSQRLADLRKREQTQGERKAQRELQLEGGAR